jgi:hypothetical protein
MFIINLFSVTIVEIKYPGTPIKQMRCIRWQQGEIHTAYFYVENNALSYVKKQTGSNWPLTDIFGHTIIQSFLLLRVQHATLIC